MPDAKPATIPVPFAEALSDLLKVKPPEKGKKKPQKGRKAEKKRRP